MPRLVGPPFAALVAAALDEVKERGVGDGRAPDPERVHVERVAGTLVVVGEALGRSPEVERADRYCKGVAIRAPLCAQTLPSNYRSAAIPLPKKVNLGLTKRFLRKMRRHANYLRNNARVFGQGAAEHVRRSALRRHHNAIQARDRRDEFLQ